VCFSNTYATIKHQGVKGCNAGLLGHGNTCRTCQPVAISLHKIVECIIVVQS
jgi:hypothetical protein